MQKKAKLVRKQVGAQIDQKLYRQIRALSIVEGRTVGEVVDDALRAYLETKGAFKPADKAKKSSA